jgi:hypothetical protein
MNAGARPETDMSNLHPAPADPGDSDTGLPGLRTWPRVYLVVVGTFFLWLSLLTTLTVMFP